jgi:hypothetical protein
MTAVLVRALLNETSSTFNSTATGSTTPTSDDSALSAWQVALGAVAIFFAIMQIDHKTSLAAKLFNSIAGWFANSPLVDEEFVLGEGPGSSDTLILESTSDFIASPSAIQEATRGQPRDALTSSQVLSERPTPYVGSPATQSQHTLRSSSMDDDSTQQSAGAGVSTGASRDKSLRSLLHRRTRISRKLSKKDDEKPNYMFKMAGRTPITPSGPRFGGISTTIVTDDTIGPTTMSLVDAITIAKDAQITMKPTADCVEYEISFKVPFTRVEEDHMSHGRIEEFEQL